MCLYLPSFEKHDYLSSGLSYLKTEVLRIMKWCEHDTAKALNRGLGGISLYFMMSGPFLRALYTYGSFNHSLSSASFFPALTLRVARSPFLPSPPPSPRLHQSSFFHQPNKFPHLWDLKSSQSRFSQPQSRSPHFFIVVCYKLFEISLANVTLNRNLARHLARRATQLPHFRYYKTS